MGLLNIKIPFKSYIVTYAGEIQAQPQMSETFGAGFHLTLAL